MLDTTTKLAYERTRLAYERTVQAWVRTATSMITFGFGIYKLVDIFDPDVHSRLGPEEFGVILVCMGMLVLPLATIEYRREMRALVSEYGRAPRSLAVLYAGLVAVLGVFALLLILVRPFGS